MVQKKAHVRAQSGGTQVSRRTVARGMAWSVPVVAVATTAPAYAVSPPCVPTVSFGAGSCKCPGQSQTGEEFVYYLKFCVDDTNCPQGTGTFRVLSVTKTNDTLLVGAPNACFPATLPSSPTPLDGCTTDTFRFSSANSANHLDVTFEVTTPSGTQQFTALAIPAPPNCTSIGEAQRCEACTP